MDTSSAVHQWLKTRSHKVKKIPVITVIMIRTSRARGEWPFTLKKGSPHHSIAFLCVRVREEMIKLYLRLEGLRCYPSVQRLWKVTTRLDSRKNEYSVVWQKKVQCNRGRKAIKELSYLSGQFSLITEWNYWNTLQVFNPADDNSYKGKKWKRHFAKPKRHSSI